MTINITDVTVYIAVTILLTAIQIYHQVLIKRIQKENKDLWDQVGTLTFSITAKMLEMQKDLNEKQDKK